MSEGAAVILVVDDDPFTAELTAMALEMAGYETVTAEGGVAALETLASDDRVCLVVSDMNMPFMDGLQLFDELRGNGGKQPFILLTGEEADPIRQAHPALDAVITKDEQLQEALPALVANLLVAP